MAIISYDFHIIGWQQLGSKPKVLETYIEIFVHVNTHDQKNFWFELSHHNYRNLNKNFRKVHSYFRRWKYISPGSIRSAVFYNVNQLL